MTSMTGGEAIVSGLVARGIDTVFGLPGAQVYGLFDAFHQAQLKVIGARHEQACGYMAYGYARSSGKPGVFSVVPGPGVLNASAALLTSFGSNEPVLCLTGQVPTQFLGKGRGHLHEMPDQLATLRTFVKWADRIEYPGVAPTLVSRAFQEMLSGRRGPAALEMPWDVFTQSAEVGTAEVLDTLPAPLPDADRVKDAAALVVASKHPMIFVGSGAIHARPRHRLQRPRTGTDHGGRLPALADHGSDDRDRHAAGAADHVTLALSARWTEIDPYRYRSIGDAALHA
jgi:acetolactate synthase-1/2/3 large subunit